MNINSSLRSIAIDAIMKSCEEENFKRDLLDKFPVNKPRELAKKHPESDFSRFYGMAASLPIGDPERASRFNATSKALTHVRTELELELVRKQWKGETINGRPFDELSVLSLDDSSTSLSNVRTELELELVRKQWKGETINGRPFDELSVLSLDDSSTSGDSICCQDLK